MLDFENLNDSDDNKKDFAKLNDFYGKQNNQEKDESESEDNISTTLYDKKNVKPQKQNPNKQKYKEQNNLLFEKKFEQNDEIIKNNLIYKKPEGIQFKQRPQTAQLQPQKTQEKQKQQIDDEFGSSSSSESIIDEKDGKKISREQQRKLKQAQENQEKMQKLRNEFKQWFKPDVQSIRKKNYISDQIIVEKGELEDIETARKNKESQNQGSNQVNDQFQGALKQRIQMVSKFYEDSTQNFKENQKELGIKMMESKILSKAKQDQKKIDESKRKFREAIVLNGAQQVTNNLRNWDLKKIKECAQKINSNFDQKKHEQLQNENPLEELSQIQNFESNNSKTFLISSQNEEIVKPHIKKKKKNRSYKVEENQEEILKEQEKQIQDELNQMKFQLKNFEEESNLKNDFVDLSEIQFQQNLEKPSKNIYKQSIAIFEQQNTIFQSQEVEPSTFQQNITFQQAIDTFIKNKALMDHYLKLVRADESKKNEKQQISLMDQIFNCINGMKPILNSPELMQQKDIILAIQKMRLRGYEQDSISPFELTKIGSSYIQHHQILNTFYKFLSETQKDVDSFGSHWQDIGFQGSDPRTDIRGSGMIGPLNALFISEKYPDSLKYIYKFSISQNNEYPLAIKLFEISCFCLQMLKNGKAYSIFNREKSVIEGINWLFCSITIKYMVWYMNGVSGISADAGIKGCSIKQMSDLNKLMKSQIETQGLIKWTNGYFKIQDHIAIKLLQGIQSQSNQQQFRQKNSFDITVENQIKKNSLIINKKKNDQQKLKTFKQQQNNNEQKRENLINNENKDIKKENQEDNQQNQNKNIINQEIKNSQDNNNLMSIQQNKQEVPKPQIQIQSNITQKKKLKKEDFMFVSKTNEVLIKKPGDINGIDFKIKDLTDCTVILLDYTAQVQVDKCKNTRMIFGPIKASIFVRDCDNCEITVSCSQFRCRNLTNSRLNIYTPNDPIIESSYALTFAPFNFKYPQLLKHSDLACVVGNFVDDEGQTHQKVNKWSQIYDFTPQDSGLNYYLISPQKFKVLRLDDMRDILGNEMIENINKQIGDCQKLDFIYELPVEFGGKLDQATIDSQMQNKGFDIKQANQS